jgi:DNA gyrase subunit A
MGRTATGVRGIRLDGDDDEAVGMFAVNDPQLETILVISENGYGKRSLIEDYRYVGRGGKGVKNINVTEKTGKVVAVILVTDDHDAMIINQSGTTIRLRMSDLRVLGRATQGVKLINLERRDDTIGAVCRVDTEKEEDLLETNDEAIVECPVDTESVDLNPETTDESNE